MENIDRNNSTLWKWGMFYYNPDDKQAWIEKPDDLGYTVNFAHKRSYLYLLLPLIPIGLIAAFLIWQLNK